MSIDQLAVEALQLQPKDRAFLAETIWESLEKPFLALSDITDKEAIALANSRNLEIERGESITLSHNELMRSLRQ